MYGNKNGGKIIDAGTKGKGKGGGGEGGKGENSPKKKKNTVYRVIFIRYLMLT